MNERSVIPAEATITTGTTGLLAVCDCPDQYPSDHLHAVPDETEVPVLIRRDGTVLNRYADGTVGVSETVADAAEADEEPYCPDCDAYIRGWVHTDEPAAHASESAPRSDMVAYTASAAERGEWVPPRVNENPIPKRLAEIIRANAPVNAMYTIATDRFTAVAHRIGETTKTLYEVSRHDGHTTYTLPAWGEACLNIRYWLLQAEIEDKNVTVDIRSDDVVECAIACSPPEWESDIQELLEVHSSDI